MSNQAHKTKVSDQAVQDLLDLIEFTPPFIRKVLEVFLGILPLLDDDEEQAVHIANQILSKTWVGIGKTKFVQRLIIELDHYYDKRAVIEAALVKCRSRKVGDIQNENL